MTPIEQRLESVLRSWIGTKWQQGQCCKGRVVDCRYFVVAVLDELYGITTPLPGRLPIDTGVNNKPSAYAAVRQLADRYPCRSLGNDAPEPGDAIIVRPKMAHPETLQHLMIVGPQGRIWHAGGGGVCYTTSARFEVTNGFRMLEKDRWALVR